MNNSFINNYNILEDIPYGKEPLQLMDIYVSINNTNSHKNIFTLIFMHGGAYFQSDKNEELRYIIPYLDKGYNVVNINYRLKKGMFLATEDVVTALNFLSANNSSFKLNLKRIILKGFSSGAHIAANIGLLANKKGNPFNLPINIKFCAIINISGPSHSLIEIEKLFSNAEDKYLQEIGKSFFPPHPKYSKNQIIRLLEPVNHFDKDSPPIFLWIGGKDKEIPPFTHDRFIPKLNKHEKSRVVFMEKADHIPTEDELKTIQNEVWGFIINLNL